MGIEREKTFGFERKEENISLERVEVAKIFDPALAAEKPIFLSLPTTEQIDLLFEEEGKERKFSKQGREFAQNFYQELLDYLPEGSKIEEISSFFDDVFGQLKEKGVNKELIYFLEKSARARLEIIRRTERLEEMQASNSPFISLLEFLKKHYFQFSESFVENFSLPVILKSREFLKSLAKSAARKEERDLFESYLEEKFVEILEQVLVADPTLKLKSAVAIVKERLEQMRPYEQFQELNRLLPEVVSQDIKEVGEKSKKESWLTRLFSGTFKRFGPFILSLTILGSGFSPRVRESFASLLPNTRVVSSLVLTNLPERPEAFPAVEELLLQLKEPITERIEVPKEEILRLKEEGLLSLEPGSTFYTEDLIHYLDQLTKQISTSNLTPQELQKYVKTVKLLQSAKMLYPQATKFQLVERKGIFSLEPLDWQEQVETKERITTEVLIIGGELQSIVGAILAAKEGKEVVLLYTNSLGGLSSDEGGNMRFFDYVSGASETTTMREVFDALGMKGDKQWVVPSETEEKLLRLLASYPNIKLLKTDNLNSLRVNLEGKQIKSILTQEGYEIFPRWVIDSSPNLEIAEKSHLPFTVETLNISYGAVFDIENLTSENLDALERISPEKILALSGVTKEEVKENPELWQAYSDYLKIFGEKTSKVGFHTRWGYQSLAAGFDLYGKLKSLREPENQILREANKRRIATGFNVAIEGSDEKFRASFNSLCYRSEKSYHQGDHNLREDDDPLFRIIRFDCLLLEKFLKELTGNENLRIIVPKELYVRQATKNFSTPNILTFERLSGSSGKFSFKYHLDARGIDFRFPDDEGKTNHYKLLEALENIPLSWQISAQHTLSQVENLFLVSQGGGVEPNLTPFYRILQNLMLVMEELVTNLDKGEYWQRKIPEKKLAKAERVLEEIRRDISYGLGKKLALRFGLFKTGAVLEGEELILKFREPNLQANQLYALASQR